MKRLLLFAALSFCYFKCPAQNWECLKSNTQQYFVNSFGYLRGMRIDSVRNQGVTRFYYPFHTPRGRYVPPPNQPNYVVQPMDSNGGSWLGKKVTSYADGSWFFDNYWGDTVIVRTQAHPGDIWLFYDDTTNIHYTATLVSTDTMTVMNVIDSIKTMVLTSYQGVNINTNDLLNNVKIILSKNHGFVQTIDLYMFPLHEPDTVYGQGFDLWLDNISYTGPDSSNIAFTQVSFHNPDKSELYDYNVGDVFEWTGDNSCLPYKKLDSITGKTVISPSETQYQVSRRTYQFHAPPASPVTTFSAITLDIISGLYMIIDTGKMPEEVSVSDFYYYNPLDSSQCYVSAMYGYGDNFIYNNGNGYFVNTFEPCGFSARYKSGFWMIYDAECYDPTPCANDHFDQITFSRKSDNPNGPCGSFSPIPLDLIQVSGPDNIISIYPNPADDLITVQADKKLKSVYITNVLGQVIYAKNCKSSIEYIDVSILIPGLYYARLHQEDGTVLNKSLLIKR